MSSRTPEQFALDRQLARAVMPFSTVEVERLLAAGADPNMRQSWDEPLLSVVASYGDPADLLVLIRAGAVVTAVDKNGRTPLDCALDYGMLANAAVLLDHGADINSQHVPGQTMPGWAAAIHADQLWASTSRTEFILSYKPDFTLVFVDDNKNTLNVNGLLQGCMDRYHGVEIQNMVLAHITAHHQREVEERQRSERQQRLHKSLDKKGDKFKL